MRRLNAFYGNANIWKQLRVRSALRLDGAWKIVIGVPLLGYGSENQFFVVVVKMEKLLSHIFWRCMECVGEGEPFRSSKEFMAKHKKKLQGNGERLFYEFMIKKAFATMEPTHEGWCRSGMQSYAFARPFFESQWTEVRVIKIFYLKKAVSKFS